MKWTNAKYEGNFKNGKKHGSGKYWYKSGAYFQGVFDAKTKTQTGTMYYDDGTSEYGTWEVTYRVSYERF